ncbi:MAG TPA: cytochrome P450 [Aggregatilineales bacterium]|nr:cytochrome P450 [Aggregatilineales bacterium]
MANAVSTNPNNLPLPPGSFGLPFVGETLQFLFDPGYLARRIEKEGPIIRTHILGRPCVMMNGPEANRFVLSTGMKHFSWGEGWPVTFREILGRSLFLQDGEEHRRNRKLIMPAFHREALRNYLSSMEQLALRYLDKWVVKGEFAWFEENKQLTFEIASELLMGSKPGDDVARLSRLFTELTLGLTSAPVNLPFMTYGKALRARDALLKHIEVAIHERQQNPGTDALSLLVMSRDEQGDALSMTELKAQALLLLFAGHETTTSMLTSFCMSMAQNPEVWAKARAEQESVDIEGPLTLDAIKQMTYLEQVLKEVERLYAPVPGGFRGVVEPFDFNGYHIPKGWMVLYGIPAAHQDPAIYPEPSRFDPDRFSPERAEDAKMPFSLVGFGGGPRICVGYAFAQLELKIIASYLLRQYTWELLPGQSLDYVLFPTLRPKDGLKVRFRRLQ